MVTDYNKLYADFLSQYVKSVTTGEEAGLAVAQLAQCFAEANIAYATADIAYNRKASDMEQVKDGNGKEISSTKAKSLAQATPEYAAMLRAKTDVENIEQMINGLKSLQKGILNEFAHMGMS